MDILEAILTRRSVREFTGEPVGRDELRAIVEAGTWAPSGLNNQPWRFALVTDRDIKEKMSSLTKYARIIRESAALIVTFVDTEAMYHEAKDHQSVGACLQNMLLASHARGLGAVWLGEILRSASEVRELLGLPENLELMAVIALGHPTEKKRTSSRKPLKDVLLKEI